MGEKIKSTKIDKKNCNKFFQSRQKEKSQRNSVKQFDKKYNKNNTTTKSIVKYYMNYKLNDIKADKFSCEYEHRNQVGTRIDERYTSTPH